MPDTSPPAHDAAHDAHDSHGIGHIAPARILIGTGLALLVFTWFTVFVASIELGELNIWVALGVAVCKGTLVALFFMHLRWDRPFNSIVCVGSIAFVALFLALAMTDSAEYQEDVLRGDSPSVVAQIEANALSQE